MKPQIMTMKHCRHPSYIYENFTISLLAKNVVISECVSHNTAA